MLGVKDPTGKGVGVDGLEEDVFNNLFNTCADFTQEMAEEVDNAIKKHGFPNTPFSIGMDIRESFVILSEEVGEVARALTRDEGSLRNLRAELVQVATMAMAMWVSLDGR